MFRMQCSRFLQLRKQIHHVLLSVSFVEGNLDIDSPHLSCRDVVLQQKINHPIRVDRVCFERHSIEEITVSFWLEPDLGRPHGKQLCQSVDSSRNASQATWPVIDRIHGRHIGEQSLGCANVGGRLVKPDVLLSSLQRHANCLVTLRIDTYANDAAWHAPRSLLTRGQVRRSRSTVQHWNPKTLHAPNNDIRSELRWWLRDAQCKRVCRHDQLPTMRVQSLSGLREIFQHTASIRILH
mmetsp:Transcript_25937/g.57235  ORF Transcript_25937/g.57235 Transcript_25937/m.57235 type:complete len:238 (+) Transcript_25937:1777-2490(+)